MAVHERDPAAPELEGGEVPGPDLDPGRAAADDAGLDAPLGEPSAGGQEPLGGEGVLEIGDTQHLGVVGASRSGKTTFVKALLRGLASYVIVDSKRADFGPEWGMVTEDPEAILHEPKVVWQPRMDWVDSHPKGDDPWGRGLGYIYAQRGVDPRLEPDCGVTVYFDECRLTAPTDPHPAVKQLVVSGMGRNIGVWWSSQNPYHVFGNLLSDAFHVVAFRLNNARDRAKVEADTVRLRSNGSDPLGELERHDFLYFQQGARAWTGPHRINLQGLT